MQGISRESQRAGRDALQRAFDSGSVDGGTLGGELYAVAGLLDGNGGLRRALTDSNTPEDSRSGLVAKLLGNQVSRPCVEVLSDLVTHRWSASRDLSDAVEQLGTQAVVTGAEREGVLSQVEDEVFRFGRIVAGDQRLERALTDSYRSSADRTTLVDQLLGNKVDRHTRQLVAQLVGHPRGRRLENGFDEIGTLIAARREQRVALVTSAVMLTHEQRSRLSAALNRMYGTQIHLNIDLDPSLIGGLRIEVGDDVLDGSVLQRLNEAHRRIAS